MWDGGLVQEPPRCLIISHRQHKTSELLGLDYYQTFLLGILPKRLILTTLFIANIYQE